MPRLDPKTPRKEMQQARVANIAEAVKLYAIAKNQPEPRSQTEIYKEIAEKMNCSMFSAMTWVQIGYRRKSEYAIPPTHIRSQVEINGDAYLPPKLAANVLGVKSSTVHDWISYEIGPKFVVMKINGRDQLVYRFDEVVRWKATMDPKADKRGRLHYFDSSGKPYLAGPNGPVNVTVTKETGEKRVLPFKAQEKPKLKLKLKPKALPRAKPVPPPVDFKAVEFDDSQIAEDGLIHSLKEAAQYVGLPYTDFTTAFYGMVSDYKSDKKYTIACTKVGRFLRFDPKVLRQWRMTTYHGVSNVVRSEGAKRGHVTRRLTKEREERREARIARKARKNKVLALEKARRVLARKRKEAQANGGKYTAQARIPRPNVVFVPHPVEPKKEPTLLERFRKLFS